jgi:predicted component of type VI protein secretion system
MPAQLVSLTDGPNIEIDKPILLIGRHPECDIQIESRKISRRHCCIAQVADYLVVRDLGSTNGIRINGVRVLEGRLNQNDELTIGGHCYRVRWDLVAESAPRPDRALRAKIEAQPPLHPIPADDDDRLEACDEPVPLVDPRGERSPHAGVLPPREMSAEKPPRALAHELSPSPIIPEELKLTSASDVDRQDSRAS